MKVLVLITSVSIFLSLVFWSIGAPWILPFALIESLLSQLAGGAGGVAP